MKRLLIPLLASISLSPIIQADQRNEAIKINSKNYSELCNSAKSLEYADEMMSWYPSYKYFKKSSTNSDVEYLRKNIPFYKKRVEFTRAYKEKCKTFCHLMKPTKPSDEGFIHAGKYGQSNDDLCQDRWVKKIRLKNNRLEFIWGSTDRLYNYDNDKGELQKISDSFLFASQTQVDCTKWESWDKYNKIWQPINKGTIDDFAAEKFCKKNFFNFW